jgi:hypothetical protein
MAVQKDPSARDFLHPSPSRQSGSDAAVPKDLRPPKPADLGALYDAYFPRVYRYFWRRRASVAEIEEATEAALCAVFEGVCSGEAQLPLERWIFSQVRKVARLSDKSLHRLDLRKNEPNYRPQREISQAD